MSLHHDREKANRSSWLHARAPRLILAAVLLTMWGRSLPPLLKQSQTVDEAAELAAGYVQLVEGFYAANAGHPPVTTMLHAIGLLPLRPNAGLDRAAFRTVDMFGFGNRFLYEVNDNFRTLLTVGRLHTMVLATFIVLIGFFWSRALFGAWGGALTAFLLGFDPNFLAHSTLATTDITITLLLLAAVFCVWRYSATGRLRWVAAMGVSFGIACAGKLNGVLLFPLLAVVTLFAAPGAARTEFTGRAVLRRALLAVGLCAITAVIASLTIWAVYRFQVGTLASTGRYDALVWDLLERGFSKRLAHLTVPAPWYWWCILFQRSLHPRPFATWFGPFFFGRVADVPAYLVAPAEFILKTPIPGLLLLAGALAIAARPPRWRDAGAIYSSAILFAVGPMLWPSSGGYRHMLPAMPLAAIALGGLVKPRRARRWALALSGAALAWFAVESAAIHPHYLAYFNQFAGGPSGGHRYLVDSDLDWGQDLPGLAGYVRDHKIEVVFLDYYGSAPIGEYGLSSAVTLSPRREPLLPPDADPAKHLIAVSATRLQMSGPDWPLSRAPVPYAWLKWREPIDTIGHSIFLYRLRRQPRAPAGDVLLY